MTLHNRSQLVLYSLLLIGFWLNLIVDSPVFHRWFGWLAFSCAMISFVGSRRLFQWFSLLFVLVALTISFQEGRTWEDILPFWTSNALLLALLYVLPFLTNMVVIGRYDQSIKRLMETRIHHLGQAYVRTSLASYILCIFLFFAAIPLVYRVAKSQLSNMEQQIRDSFASRAVLRAFALAAIWSPIEVFIAITIGFTGVGYGQLFPWLLLFSVSLLLVDWVWNQRYRSIQVKQRERAAMRAHHWRRIGILLLALSLLIVINLGVQQLTKIEFFAGMTLIIVPFATAWAWLSGRLRSFLRYCRLKWATQTSALQNFMLLFLSLGFFNEVITTSSWFGHMQGPVMGLAQHPLLLFGIMQVSSLVLTFIGIHPLVTIGIQGVLIQPLLTELNPVSVAIVLLTANLATDAAGTFNTTVTMMSEFTRTNPYRITWWNLGFAFLYGSVGILLAMLLL